LRDQGLIRQLGVSTVNLDQLAEAQQVAPVACVENFFKIASRVDEAVLAATAEQHIAYVPYFPLGGFSPVQSDVLSSVSECLGATPTAVAQAWLLQRSPNIMLIPGTSSSPTCARTSPARPDPAARRGGRAGRHLTTP